MTKPRTIEKRKQSQLEEVLDFSVHLGREMLASGANLERVQLAVERIAHAYRLEDLSIHMFSSYIALAARDAEGRYASRQCSVPASSICLGRLRSLNRLSYAVVSGRPLPERLDRLLEEALKTPEYPEWLVLLAKISAILCLCLLFGGGPRELAASAVSTAVLCLVMRLFEKTGLNRIVTNVAIMFLATASALLFVHFGFSSRVSIILTTVVILLIPGIALFNAVHNLLCGNEMNGIFQLAKAVIETLALAVGMCAALWLFGQDGALDQQALTPQSNPAALELLAFATSVCFAVVFGVAPRDLALAGLGGALARAALMLSQQFVPNRMACVCIAALTAALYAELLATQHKDPAPYFAYPSIIPLIPGDLFFFAIAGLYLGDRTGFETNAVNCLLSLLGMSVGFVLSLSIAHYIRKNRFRRLIRLDKSPEQKEPESGERVRPLAAAEK